jgi:Uma2 family endonuclease
MGQAAKRPRATYAEYEAVPPHLHAEIVYGTLYVMSRPAPRHSHAASRIGGRLDGPFGLGEGGPGGWWILDQPEIHFLREEPVVPDLAGWRRQRMPRLPDTAYFTLPPDWVCEVLSPSTARLDREEKMYLYAEHGVKFAWLIDPIAKTLEAYALGADGKWNEPLRLRDRDRGRIAPFEAIELALAVLWAD